MASISAAQVLMKNFSLGPKELISSTSETWDSSQKKGNLRMEIDEPSDRGGNNAGPNPFAYMETNLKLNSPHLTKERAEVS